MKIALPLLGLLFLVSCNTPATSPASAPAGAAAAAADPLRQAVATYIKAHADAFAGYEPVRWGAPAAYTRMNEAAIKGVVAMQAFDDALTPRNQALANYKASLARHDKPAQTAAIMARYGKANKYNDSLLAIANAFIGTRDTTRLGTQIGHSYRARNAAGTVALDSATFVVYRDGRVEQL